MARSELRTSARWRSAPVPPGFGGVESTAPRTGRIAVSPSSGRATSSNPQNGAFSTIAQVGARRRLVDAHRDDIVDAARRHHATDIRLFGSAARNEDTELSDLDFLVEFEDGSSLFDLMHLRDDLEELLRCPVDVVSAGSLTARDEHILAEAIPL